MFSLDGGVSLRPFDTPVERAVDPLQVYVAVRQSGYWAEGSAVLAVSPLAGALAADPAPRLLPRCRPAGHAVRSRARSARPSDRSGRIRSAPGSSATPSGLRSKSRR